MAERLRKSDEMIETLSFLDVLGRVSRFLIRLTEKEGEVAAGLITIDCPTHQEIANKISSSREAVTKAIKTLSTKGFIKIKGKVVRINAEKIS